MTNEELQLLDRLMSEQDHLTMAGDGEMRRHLCMKLADEVPGLVSEVRRLNLQIGDLKKALREAVGMIEGRPNPYGGNVTTWKALLVTEKPLCEHEWVDARNKYVQSGELCLKCHAIRAGNAVTDKRKEDC